MQVGMFGPNGCSSDEPAAASAAFPLNFDPAVAFASMLESSADCVKLIDRGGALLSMNENGQRLMAIANFGLIRGQTWWAFWPEAERERVRQAFLQSLEGEAVRFQAPCPTAAGELKHWDVALTPLRDVAGAVTGVLSVSRDVTDQVAAAAEAQVRESELARSAAALAAAGVLARIGRWELDLETGEVQWSKEIWQLLGAEPRAIFLDEAMLIYPAADRPWIRELFAHAQRTGEQITYKVQVQRFDGTLIWARMVGEPVPDEGRFTRLRGVAQDVTELEAAHRELERTERRLRLATAAADLHVYDVDFTTRSIAMPTAEVLFDRPVSFECYSSDPVWFVDPRDREAYVQAWDEFNANGGLLSVEFRVARRDGRELWVHSSAMRECNEAGELVGLVGALQDISARKAAELDLRRALDAADAASRAKGTFLANVSHEIRTPLNGVLGMAQVMERGELSEQQRARLQVIRQAGESLLALLNDILDFSKIEAGRLELELQPFDLAGLCSGVIKTFEPVAAQKDLPLQLQFAAEAQGFWQGDSARLRQVLVNLVSNAVKFTDAGKVELRVGLGPEGVEIVVEDTGRGIPAKHLHSIFDSFSQGDAATSRRYGGTGLGLSIARELVMLMGGTLTVQSRLQQGSVFSLRLPLARAAAADAPPHAAQDEPMPSSMALRVLAAEDNVTNQLILRSMLEPLGVQVTLVDDGAEALEALDRESFDLVLMDIQMPRLDGMETVKIMRDRECAQGLTRTPVIALTANVMSHQVSAYRDAGFDGIVPKPIDIRQLLDTLANLVDSGLDNTEIAAS
jgi:PAS domain S-box-containing protein